MPPRYQICCIVKTEFANHHQRLRTIGGVNPDGSRWKMSEAAAIAGIEEGHWRLYVVQAGRQCDVVVAVSKYGSKYLKSAIDRLQPDSLLALPDCR